MTARAITPGVERLAFHGCGVAPFLPREQVRVILAHIRASGTLTRRDLHRHIQSFANAEQRDGILTALAREGLVTLDGKQVSAVPLGAFIDAVAARPGMEEPAYSCASLPEEWEREKAGGTAA